MKPNLPGITFSLLTYMLVLSVGLLPACGGGGGGGSDTTAPTVTSTFPANNAADISVSTPISATFSEALSASSVNATSFTLSDSATSISGTVEYRGTTATFTPATNLIYSTTYTATITTGVKDLAGNSMSGDYTWTFTTGATADTTAPTVTSTSPANNVTDASVIAPIRATFSEALSASSVSAASFTLSDGVNSVTGMVDYSGIIATFAPASQLDYSTTYTATITTGVKDAAGNALASDYTWTFKTRVPPLNDTGITSSQCYQAASNVLLACGSAAAISLNPVQDGMTGRDANAATKDDADGKLGFSFTDVTAGSDHCVQDNVTGLMWEVKTNDGGLRDRTKTYTNYDDTTAAQFWNGSAYVSPSQAQIDLATNSVGYRNAVNATGLCGYNDWRLPTTEELQSIVDYGVGAPGPTIDTNWFPNTRGNYYWSSSTYAESSAAYSADPSVAWYVNFNYGIVSSIDRVHSGYVRLVRAGQ